MSHLPFLVKGGQDLTRSDIPFKVLKFYLFHQNDPCSYSPIPIRCVSSLPLDATRTTCVSEHLFWLYTLDNETPEVRDHVLLPLASLPPSTL